MVEGYSRSVTDLVLPRLLSASESLYWIRYSDSEQPSPCEREKVEKTISILVASLQCHGESKYYILPTPDSSQTTSRASEVFFENLLVYLAEGLIQWNIEDYICDFLQTRNIDPNLVIDRPTWQSKRRGKQYALHLLFGCGYVKAAKILIDTGAKINVINGSGETPMHVCCNFSSMLFRSKFHQEVLEEGLSMLMYHNADPTISDLDNLIPFNSVLRWSKYNQCENTRLPQVLENLFYYTFGKQTTSPHANFEALVDAAKADSPLFHRLAEIVSVKCKKSVCPLWMFKIDKKYLKVFLDKFDHVIEQSLLYMCENLSQTSWTYNRYLIDHKSLIEALELLSNSKFRHLVVRFINSMASFILIADLIDVSLVTDTVCFFFSYGMNFVTEAGLTLIYNKGHRELFRILLHMDVVYNLDHNLRQIIPALTYKPDINIDFFVNNVDKFSVSCCVFDLLSYSSHKKVKEIANILSRRLDMGDLKKAKVLPKIPSLVELARDVFRRYFVEKLQITTSRKFYTLLKSLPIPNHLKGIISFQEKLYPDSFFLNKNLKKNDIYSFPHDMMT